jgi:glycosyltransferase involved in cell wall biosynthesis
MNIKISYVIPVFNEKNTIKKAITDVLRLPIKKEIIVIDNNSYDGTKEILINFKKKNKNKNIKLILRKKNLGGAESVMEGIRLSKGKYIFIQYADLEYDEKKSLTMYNLAERDNLDVVLGSRVKNRLKKITWFEIILSRPAFAATFITTKLFNFFYNKHFTDIIGGRLYKKEKIIKLPFDYNDASFDFAFVSRMAKSGLKMAEVDIKYEFRKFGTSGMRWYHLFNIIIAMVRIKLL